MKRIITIATILCLCLHTSAQSHSHVDIFSIHGSGLWQQDQYLSPLLYSGWSVGINNTWQQTFERDTTQRWLNSGFIDLIYGSSISERRNNSINNMALRAGWGTNYRWTIPHTELTFMLGPSLNGELWARYHTSNVNKPYSMDLNIDICANATIRYVFHGKHTDYRLQYAIRSNLIGLDYMPDYWHSYYEMSEGVLGLVRCSGWWNHRLLDHQLSLDIHLPHTTWRIGVRHEYLEYGQNSMSFSRELLSGVLGIIWHYTTSNIQSSDL